MDMRSRARELRRASTDAERAFWRQVRGRGLGGHKFRRQVPIGPYIADFLCLQARLIIEFDGGHHQEQTAADERRTQWLESEGYRVLRLWDNDVLLNITGALETVLAALGNPQGNGQGEPFSLALSQRARGFPVPQRGRGGAQVPSPLRGEG